MPLEVYLPSCQKGLSTKMAAKVDDKTYKRILQLKDLGLTDKVISIRLGISERTIRVYTRSARTKTLPYQPNVSSEDSSEETQ